MFSELFPRLRILLLEDDPRDADLVTHTLERLDPRCSVLRVDSRQAFASALDTFVPDVILSDHAIADFNALDALRLAQARLPEAPFLLVAGAFEQSTSECLRSGATDFIRKSDLSRLGSAIDTAVKLRESLRRLSKRQRQVLQMLAVGCSTREIARQLRLSVKTVETHRAQVMHRTGIHDLAGLVRYAVRVGIVSDSQGSERESAGDAPHSGHRRS
ncbi:MAG TPA: response regulator transcription factor [Gemmatimonadales bacterium]|jgi:DNA-binding NarL/FixJ family response regulator|nr:response regulator transcription factor [Gemmatimonadales bacterium]